MPAPTGRPPALVLGLQLTALGTIRALARRGVEVVAVGEREGRPAEHTRYGRKLFDSRAGTDACVEMLEELAPQFAQPPVLFASADWHAVLMSRHRDRLRDKYRYVFPEQEALETLMDKGRLAQWAARHGFLVPATAVITGPASARDAAQALRFPCVLKPSVRSFAWPHGRPKVAVLDSPEALLSACEHGTRDAPAYVAQEIIPGRDDDVYFCLVYVDRQGEVRASYGVRKRRQQPPHHGAASLAVGWPDETVAHQAVALLRTAGYRGIGSVEFRRDPRDGQLYLMEATIGRVDLNTPLATAAGVDIPYLSYCDAAELPLPEVGVKRPGLKWCDERADWFSAKYYWRRGELGLREWIGSLSGPCTYATFAWDDPLPFVCLSAGFVARAFGIRTAWW